MRVEWLSSVSCVVGRVTHHPLLTTHHTLLNCEPHPGLRIEIPAGAERIEAIVGAGGDHGAVVGAEHGRRREDRQR